MMNVHLNQQQSNLPKPLSFVDNALVIPPKTRLKETIKIEVTDDTPETLKIEIGALCEVKIMLDLKSIESGQKKFNLDLYCGQGSIVKYVSIMDAQSNQGQIFQHAYVKKDAQLDFISSLLSNQLQAVLQVDLLEEGASVNLKSLTISSDEHRQVIDAGITHYAPNSYGDMTHIGIVNKKGQVVLNGTGKIEKGMKNANAFQHLKGIILSDFAVCEVNPVLIIDEFDVKAGHGATVGKIEENQLYYLMSRGLSQKEAERLIISGFIKPIVDEIDDEDLQQRFEKITSERI